MTGPDGIYNVLFLCTGNSARSIMAEALLNKLGAGRFRGYSAGSLPTGVVNPLALQTLERHEVPTSGARSKNWSEFAQPGAPQMHFVFTVCDNAANEVCPLWPGQPVSAHWGIPDPAAATGNEAQRAQAFREAYATLERRIGIFTSLPMRGIEQLALQRHVDEIGRS